MTRFSLHWFLTTLTCRPIRYTQAPETFKRPRVVLWPTFSGLKNKGLIPNCTLPTTKNVLLLKRQHKQHTCSGGGIKAWTPHNMQCPPSDLRTCCWRELKPPWLPGSYKLYTDKSGNAGVLLLPAAPACCNEVLLFMTDHCTGKISWSQTWPFHQRSPKSHQWFHQISTNSIALTCTHSSNNVRVTLISLCESVTLSPRPPVRRKKDRLRSWIRFLLLAQISFSEICLLSDYRNYTPSSVLQEAVQRGCAAAASISAALLTPQHLIADCGSAPTSLPYEFGYCPMLAQEIQ